MPDQVSKSMSTVGWILISIIGFVATVAALWGIFTFFLAAAIAAWLKILVAIGLLGFGLLCTVVVRDRLQESKSDKYKDIEV